MGTWFVKLLREACARRLAEYIADTTCPDCKEYGGTRAVYLTAVRSSMRKRDWKGFELVSQEQGNDPNEAFITFKAGEPYR